ncbi:hypothetical protein E4T56_gene6071, partial [Termitomyces sp. T112]
MRQRPECDAPHHRVARDGEHARCPRGGDFLTRHLGHSGIAVERAEQQRDAEEREQAGDDPRRLARAVPERHAPRTHRAKAGNRPAQRGKADQRVEAHEPLFPQPRQQSRAPWVRHQQMRPHKCHRPANPMHQFPDRRRERQQHQPHAHRHQPDPGKHGDIGIEAELQIGDLSAHGFHGRHLRQQPRAILPHGQREIPRPHHQPNHAGDGQLGDHRHADGRNAQFGHRMDQIKPRQPAQPDPVIGPGKACAQHEKQKTRAKCIIEEFDGDMFCINLSPALERR